MKGATVLRAVSSELRDAIAAFTWNDANKLFLDRSYVMKWRACFPNARAANLRNTTVPAEAFVLLRDLVTLDLQFSDYSAAALVAEHYSRLTSLSLAEKDRDFNYHSQDEEEDWRLTDASLGAISRHFPLLTSLNLYSCLGLVRL
jgi:hypothetical protein